MKEISSDIHNILSKNFIQVNGMKCNDRVLYDSRDYHTSQELNKFNGYFAINRGVCVVILNNIVYVSPLGYQLKEQLIRSGLTETMDIYVPISQDPYFDYPYVLGPDTALKIAAQNINDPIGSIQKAREQIFNVPTFKKWEALLEQSRGITLSKWLTEQFKKKYDGPENAEFREHTNEILRKQMLEVLNKKPELLLEDNPNLKNQLNSYYENQERNRKK